MKKPPFPGTHIEWSTNEKVAIEVAATCAWAGKRSLCTMKMSGLNVAYDSMIGIAHSGVIGGMVVYVCDDPGVTTGMCEQDSRGFAQMSDMVMLEPGSVAETYEMIKYAFDLSEKIQEPVFIRSVTTVAQSHAQVDVEERMMPDPSVPVVKKDINKYAKAGAAMCMAQHQDCIDNLAKGAAIIESDGLNKLTLGRKGGIGVIAVGTVKNYVEEGAEIAEQLGWKRDDLSVLYAACTIPHPINEIQKILQHCSTIIVAEELEPYMERQVFIEACQLGKHLRIVGKTDNTLKRVGAFNAMHVAKAIMKAFDLPFDDALLKKGADAAALALPRPITVCAGCPHRGTYLAINAAIRNARLKKEEVIVCGDIGCTILGMNPPFNTVWMEISMGASIPCATGFYYSGIDKPIFATIGDSTFFHNGMPGLANAIQHDVNAIVIVMDNGWTAMTGMQVNPNTEHQFQREGDVNIDLVNVIKGMGVKHFYLTDPYDLAGMTKVLDECLTIKGLKVVVARRECAIEAGRRNVKYAKVHVDEDKCINCKICISTTGCSALIPGEKYVRIDPAACNGCSLCAQVCPKKAIIKEEL
jgi:indolepyruvate ferredoxin oxidoreductase alpha subunit